MMTGDWDLAKESYMMHSPFLLAQDERIDGVALTNILQDEEINVNANNIQGTLAL